MEGEEKKEFFSGSSSRISIKVPAVRPPALHFDITFAITIVAYLSADRTMIRFNLIAREHTSGEITATTRTKFDFGSSREDPRALLDLTSSEFCYTKYTGVRNTWSGVTLSIRCV